MRSLFLFFALLAVLYVSIRVGEQLLDAPQVDTAAVSSENETATSRDINRGRGSLVANVTIAPETPEPTPEVTPAPHRPSTLVIIKRPSTPLKTRPDAGTGTRTHTTDSALLNALETQTPAIDISNGTARLNLPQPSPEMPPVDLLVIIDADDPALEEDTLAETNAQTQARNGTGEVIPPPHRPRFVDPPPERPRRLTTPPSVPLYYVQMASFRDEDKAWQAAALLTEKHKSRLDYVRVGITSIDRGREGVWWRVVTEEMTRLEATSLCTTLKSAGQDCVLRNLETGEELVRSPQ